MICLSDEAILVRGELIKNGLETPMSNPAFLTSKQKKDEIENHFVEILKLLGLDLTDDSLVETPHRIAKMYVNEIFSGLDYQSFPKITVIDNKMKVDEMIKVSDISLMSTCEHHFVTIDGFATIAYIPSSKVIGLSKINRIVQFFSRRPQVQERLTQQILVALQVLLESKDVAISINATHHCVKSRGIMDSSSYTTTTSLGGVFKSRPETRAEFLSSKT